MRLCVSRRRLRLCAFRSLACGRQALAPNATRRMSVIPDPVTRPEDSPAPTILRPEDTRADPALSPDAVRADPVTRPEDGSPPTMLRPEDTSADRCFRPTPSGPLRSARRMISAWALQDDGELREPPRVRGARIGRLRPGPARFREQCAHGVDVAVVGRALDGALGGAGPQQLDEERVQLPARREPAVQLVGVGAPLVRVQRAQAGLLVDRVEGVVPAARRARRLRPASRSGSRASSSWRVRRDRLGA